MSFDPVWAKRLKASFRLRTMMILVVLVALGLAAEVDRRRQVELHRLRQISEGRRTLVAIHQAGALEYRRQLAETRKQVDQKKSGPPYSGGFWSGPVSQEEHFEFLKQSILDLEKQVAWEDAMVANSTWAADHPGEPWPARPAQPVMKTFVEWHNASPRSRLPNMTTGSSKAAGYPFQPVVPANSKKNQ